MDQILQKLNALSEPNAPVQDALLEDLICSCFAGNHLREVYHLWEKGSLDDHVVNPCVHDLAKGELPLSQEILLLNDLRLEVEVVLFVVMLPLKLIETQSLLSHIQRLRQPGFQPVLVIITDGKELMLFVQLQLSTHFMQPLKHLRISVTFSFLAHFRGY